MDDNEDQEATASQQPVAQHEKYSRRKVLQIGMAAVGSLLFSGSQPKAEKKPVPPVQTPDKETTAFIQQLAAEIDSLPLTELENEVYREFPVIPDIGKIQDNLNEITAISQESNLMIAGTSVALGMLESIDQDKVDVTQINLGDEQHKADAVLQYFQILSGEYDNGAILIGGECTPLWKAII